MDFGSNDLREQRIRRALIARLWHHPAVLDGGLRVDNDHHLGGEYIFTPNELTLSLVRGPALTLEQIVDGRRWLGRSTRGTINVMPRGATRVFRHHDGCEFACVTVPGELDVRPQVALRDDPLRLVLEALVAEADTGEATRLFRDGIALAIVARLQALDRRAPDAPSHGLAPACLARVLEYLDAHLRDDVSVDTLARLANLSPAHFSTLFRNSFGEPPHQHMLRLRVERARVLLEGGTDPSAAAFAVGFYDQSHLSRHMRRMLGVTPGMIARARHSSKERPERRGNVRDPR